MFAQVQRHLATLGEVFHLIWTDASRFVKLRLGSATLLVIVAAILTALGPVALKLVVDRFTGHGSAQSFSPIVLITAYALSQWLARSAGEIRGLVYARAERRMFRTLSERLFAHLMQLPLRFHLNRQTGAISQTLANGLQGYQMVLHHIVFTFLPVGAQLGTIVLVLARLNHPVFLGIFCGAFALYAGAFSYAAVTTSRAAKQASSAHVDANAAMTDSILNYETVKYFTAEAVVQDRVSQALSRAEMQWVAFYRQYAVNGLGVSTIFAVFLGLAMLFAAREVSIGRMTVGDFVLVNSYMLQVMQPVEMLGYAVQGLSQGTAMLAKMMSLFREETEPTQVLTSLSAQPAPMRAVPVDAETAPPSALKFENVGLSYTSDRSVLQGVSFWVPAGKTVGIVGASGSGKSTLVRLLVRLIEPDHGRILLDGTPISEVPLRILRQSVAVVPQDTILFNDTIGYNIGFGQIGSSRWEIERAAKLAHLHEFVAGLPDGYDTRVGERGVKLSGGEKQRISIARAALKRPRIYVFDEATSSLDSRTESAILTSLQELARSSTTLVIAHRLSTVVHADEIVVLDQGRITERGSHSALLQQSGHYAALWDAQQRGHVAA
jgi:ABC-type transport system involved in Fe-S cluster assembly fused permease/ATPase subunit